MDHFNRSIVFFECLGLDPCNKDEILLHALEKIGAISSLSESEYQLEFGFSSVLDKAKLRIFWKTIKEIASLHLETRRNEINDNLLNQSSAVKMVLHAFPDKEKETDGRIWLPMHFAVSAPDVELTDIQVLHEAQPNSILTLSEISLSYERVLSVTPCHLAVMTKPNNMDIIDL